LEADVSRRKRKKALDKLAAAIILQGYMDRSKNSDDDPSF
jgi:putative Holliday junction resolvase